MSDFINVFITFLTNIAQLDIFQYFVMSVGVFGVILLFRKIVYA